MDKLKPSNIKSVLVVRIGKIGDIIATSFVFEVIKRNNPDIKISLITKSSNKDVLCYNPSIDSIHYLGKGIFRYFQLWKLKNNKYDLIIDFNDNPSKTTKLIFTYFNANNKCGYDFPLYSNCLDWKVEQLKKESSHIIDRMKHFLENIGFTCEDNIVKPVLYLGNKEVLDAETSLNKYKNKKIIALNISAGADIRLWRVKNWIKLVECISGISDEYRFVLLNSKENDVEASEIVNALNPEIIYKPELPTFQHFASFIKLSNLLISPDTSAVHIASAFNRLVIALYPKSDWNFASWLPFKVQFKAVHSETNDINSISIDKIFIKFKELIGEIN